MERNELPFLSALELADLFKSGQASPVEATEAYLARIERVDPSLSSYITVTAEQAMAEARAAEAGNRRRQPSRPASRRAGGGEGPVLHRRRAYHRRLVHTGKLRPRLRRHGHGQAQGSRGGAAGQAEHERVRHGRLLPPPLRPPRATRGTCRATPVRPAAAPERPPPRSCAPRRWARTPPAPSAARPPSAGWSASARHGGWSAATECWRPPGRWTPPGRFPGR